ncbi:MAG: uroporphyrinogen decarboxylase family protein [Candidatus Humimicrobiaceae bacterium]
MSGSMEKVFKATNRINQDILLTQIDYTPEMKENIKKILSVNENEVDKRLGNHIKYLPLNDIVKVDKDTGIKYDIWGIGWDLVLTEGFHIRVYPLEDSENYMEYKFPEPSDTLLLIMKKQAQRYKRDFFLLSLQDFTLFERLWCLIGYENAFTGFYYRKKEVDYLLEGITEFNVEMSKKVVELGLVDGLRTGDDLGAQKGMLISPEMFRKFLKERYAKMWEVYKNKNLPVFHHSDGDIFEIIPDLIDIGLDVLTPIQPEVLYPEKMAREFGKNLSFMGGISTQDTLPFKSPQEVKNEIIERIKVLGKYGGYIISPSHEVTSDCKEENFLTMLETLECYRSGKLKII